MRIVSLLFCFTQLLIATLGADQLPADISFMIVDLKYSEAEGVKICELQQGTLSAFSGYDFLNKSESYVENYVINYLNRYGKPIYFKNGDVTNPTFAKILLQHGALAFNNMTQLYNDSRYTTLPTLSVKDPRSIDEYHCFIIGSPKTVSSLNSFRHTFPGALLLDAASYPFWIDKYKMTLLFTHDPLLEAAKPRWTLCQKIYTPTLASEIAEKLGGEAFVIKPRSSFLGFGVIIVSKEGLNELLQQIIERKEELMQADDKDLKFWATEPHQSFIIEKFCPSDPVTVPHYDHKQFDGTMRVVFLMNYSRGKIEIEFVELHWKLPALSLSETGTLTQVRKSIGKIPHFAHVTPEIKTKVERQLRKVMRRVYRRMLGLDPLPKSDLEQNPQAQLHDATN